MATLTSEQFDQLQSALLRTFDRAELIQLVRLGLDEDLDVIAGGDTLADRVFNLIRWAERRDRMGDLARSAQRERPNDALLARLARDLSAASSTSGSAPNIAAPGGISIGKIEAVNVGQTQYIDQRGSTFHTGDKTEIHTDGGSYIAGSVDTGGGDFIGRDKTAHGDEAGGNEVAGDKTAGDKAAGGDK